VPLLWVCLSFLAGVFLADHLTLTWILLAILAVVLTSFALFENRVLHHLSRWSRLRALLPIAPSILLLFILTGMLRYQLSTLPPNPDGLAYYNDKGKFTLSGWVSAPPDQREDKLYLQVTVTELEDPFATDPAEAVRKMRGKARLTLPAGSDYHYGDLLRFTAAPLTPSDDSDFSYKKYLSRLNIHTVIYYPGSVMVIGEGEGSRVQAGLETFRQSVRRRIFAQFPQPESSLLAGVLLGLDQDLPGSLESAYQATGTAHIIAISGSNMALLAAVMLVLLSRLMHKKWAILITAPVVVLYTLFVGGSASVIRAAAMSILAFGGHLIGRKHAGMTALFLTAAVMCLFNPQVIADAGFQLSFAATFGLLLFAQPLQLKAVSLLEKILPPVTAAKAASPLSTYFLFTLAAQVTTLPIIAIHFGRVSLSSLVANPLVLPAQPFVLGFGAFSALARLLHPLAGKVTALAAWPLLAYTNRVVETLGKLKWGSLTLHPGMAPWLLGILMVFILLFALRDFFTKKLGGRFTWIVFALVLASASVWSIALHQPDGRLHVNLLRAGDDTSLFVISPAGKTLLLDPGKEVNELSTAITKELSPWNFHLDEVWLTKAENGKNLLSLNERIPVTQVVLAPVVFEAHADQKGLILPEGLEAVKLPIGTAKTYETGFQAQFLTDDPEHTAIYITYGDTTILVPNGVDFAKIRDVAPQALDHPTVLVLNDADISYIPPRVWDQAGAGVVLWNSATLSPREDWISMGEENALELLCDGSECGLY
jgi:competence protein ComEC